MYKQNEIKKQILKLYVTKFKNCIGRFTYTNQTGM